MSTEITPTSHVADRAYYLWEQAGRPHGRDLEFWILAEADIRAASRPNDAGLAVAHPRPPLKAAQAGTPPSFSGAQARPRAEQPFEKTPRKAAPRLRQP
jgi:hypothetical protein